jgi:sugar (pentulose or hexulose) kinase
VRRPLTIGVDLGTTAIKAAVFDVRDPGRPVAFVETRSPTSVPRPGHSEANMTAVLHACFEAIAEVAAEVAAAQVGSIGVSGTACGAWLIDEHGSPVRDAILWNDGRGATVTTGWIHNGQIDEIFAIGRNVPYPAYTLPLLRWLLENEPQTIARARTVLTSKDWIRWGLTGEIATEQSDASYAPFDVEQRCWSQRLLEIAGIAEAARLLPPIESERHVTALTPASASQLGLPNDVLVGMGLTDIVACTLGAGGAASHGSVTALGTSAVSSIVQDALEYEAEPIGLTAAAPLGRWVRTMVNTAGSMTLDWAADLLYDGDLASMLAAAAAAEPHGDEEVVLLPYLSGAGVASPFVSPNARCVIGGLRIGHDKSQVALAAVQGLAFAIADCHGAMPEGPTEIFAVGGAARSDLLLQAIADASARTVHRVESPAPGARGAALVAARGAGQLADDEELLAALSSPPIGDTFQPRRAAAAYGRYRRLRDATRPLWDEWSLPSHEPGSASAAVSTNTHQSTGER